MARVGLQTLEICGDPKSDSGDLPVRLVYSDNPLPDAATVYIEVRVEMPAGYDRVLAELEKDAAKRARAILDQQIARIESLK